MAKIPIYQSSQRLTTEAPQAVRESPQAAGQFARDLQGVGESITQVHDTIRQAYDFQQVGSAKLKTLEGVNALEVKASQDGNNTGDLSEYDGELRRLKVDTLKGITNPSARKKFEMDFDLQAAQTRTQISAIFRKNMVSQGMANLAGLNTYFANEYAQTGDKSYLESMEYNIDTYTQKGFLTAEAAQKLNTAAILDAKEKAFVFDLDNNPAIAGEKLDKNVYEFDVERLAKAKDVFDREIKKIQDDTENSVIDLYINNKLSVNDVKTLREEGKIGAKFTTQMLAKITKTVKDKPISEQIVKYNELTSRATKLQRRENWLFGLGKMPYDELAVLRSDILEAANQGYLNESEAKKILGLNSKAWNERYPGYDNAVNAITSYCSLYPDKSKETVKKILFNQLYERVKNGEKPDEAVQKIVKDRVNAEVSQAAQLATDNRIRVRRLSDNKLGVITMDKFDDSKYIRVE